MEIKIINQDSHALLKFKFKYFLSFINIRCFILRVFVSDVIVKWDKYGHNSYQITGRLQSGMEVIIDDYYHNLRECIGCYIDMLLSFMRSPYSEQKRGIQNQMFALEKYYSVELVDELIKKSGSAGCESVIILTGKYIDSYIIPKKWDPLLKRGSFKMLFKHPSALKTEEGTFLLYPFHSRRQIPIEQIPHKVIMAGGLSLEAWMLIQ